MRTPLYDRHVALGAKMVDFAGWEMPVQYQGIIPEHLAVRNHAGIFDVSHMGRVEIEGRDAEVFLDHLSTNALRGKAPGSATYTVWPTHQGGSVDDVIVYKQDPQHYFVIVNAGNRQKDYEHLKREAAPYAVTLQDHYNDEGILAIQGPQAIAYGLRVWPELAHVKPMHFIQARFQGMPLLVSGTGYTGAGGFEVYGPKDAIVALWDHFQQEGIPPIGLGARDTLRLEMGYALYGHELSDTIAPNESVSAWTIKWDKGDFLGKDAMQVLESSPKKRSEHGIVLLERGVPREGYVVFKDGQAIGHVTSGTHSPTLNQGIAIVLVTGQLKPGDRVEVQIRSQRVPAQVVQLPFIKPNRQ